MKAESAKITRTHWIAPGYPGADRDPYVALCIGWLLGALGVGIYLRSLVDGLFVLVITIAIVLMTGPDGVAFAWGFSGGWAAGRVIRSKRHARKQLLPDFEQEEHDLSDAILPVVPRD